MLELATTHLHNSANADFSFQYQIKHSKRKTLCVQIKRGEVRVLAPMRFPKAEILLFLQQKQTWIEAKIQLQIARANQLQVLQKSAILLCNGIEKTLLTNNSNRFAISEDALHVYLDIPSRVASEKRDAYIKKQLANWFQDKALQRLPNKLAQFSYQLELEPTDLHIKRYKARWGSCNSRGEISLNYLLMMTPDFVIDYVIVHELCHLKHMNHSASFWALVTLHYPAFKQAKLWLKQHSSQLNAFHQ
ncbi:MAG: SprT family zinc-dependent metalloprotease [Oceanospirillaceae bacterium]